MKKRLLLTNVFLFLILSIISACVGSSPSINTKNKLIINIINDLNKGTTVIVYQMKNKEKSSEQYADWAAYLNDFASSKSSNFKAYESNSEFNDEFLTTLKDKTGSYTLFLKKYKPSYFYEGVIVESMVYMAVGQAYSSSTLSPMYSAFLPEEINIKLQ